MNGQCNALKIGKGYKWWIFAGMQSKYQKMQYFQQVQDGAPIS